MTKPQIEFKSAVNKLLNSPEPIDEMDRQLHGEDVEYFKIRRSTWLAFVKAAKKDYTEPWGSGIMGASAAINKHVDAKLRELTELL